ncbi:MAG: hypothetical protein F4X69_02560 [Gemmatimonadetes bacterium]|nr:hypothetical protein [Gemmatimonadota bacterium]
MVRFILLGLCFVACGENTEPKTAESPPEVSAHLNQDTTTVHVVAEPQTDFRGLRWGMSRSEVKAVETGAIKREQVRSLVYEEEIANENVEVAFGFDSDGKLNMVSYDFEDKFGNEIAS